MNSIITTRVFLLTSILFFILCSDSLLGQSLPSNLDTLSDEQVLQYWDEAKSQGYTLEQLKSVAAINGASDDQISAFESRINSLNNGAGGLQGEQINNSLALSKAPSVGYQNNSQANNIPKNHSFGYDFFNNPNISFSPNMNLATPDNYQLGPGDKIVINLWGAAENTYELQVDRQGVLRIPNAGPVFVNGMEIKAATEIIKNKLKNIYGGISAPKTSAYKVFVSLNLSEVRSIQVNIIGEVEVPGTYTLSSLSTVLNALYASGGPNKNGSFREIKLIRDGKDPKYFDVYNYLIDGSQDGNVTLKDNDLIIVPPYLSRVSVKGAVKRPGVYELKSNESFSDLLKFVSGFQANAYKDEFSLERIDGDRLAIKEINYSNILSENLQSGDKIEVKSIIGRIENKVSINGPLYRPGSFEYEEGLTVKDLIEKASGITQAAYLERGLIYRGDEYSAKKVIPFSLRDIINNEIDVALENNDIVRLFNRQLENFNYKLSISGAVRDAGDFDYFENITIEDLILMAGGLSDRANGNIIDIYRKINDDEFETLAESFKISIGDSLDFSNTSSFNLEPGDRVSVRFLKGIGDKVSVDVQGEVNFPGNYSAEIKYERITDFINKAGGLSPYAFLKGATLVRVNPFYKESAQSLIIDNLNDQSASKLALDNRKEFRVGIDLAKILKNPEDTKQNMILKDGDRIIIPSIKSTIKTEGEVLVPSLIREDDSFTFKDYINKSGGFSSEAVRRKSYVIYPNGNIASTKNFLFFKNYPKLEAGSIIVVPKKIKNPNPVSTEQVLGITSGFATIALLVDRIFRN